MTYTKNYEFGPMNFKCYFKPVGEGYEVAVCYGGEAHFVGNFVHKKEAVMWWKKMKSEMNTFCHKYEYVGHSSSQWYCHFLSNQLYKTYYKYLDTVFSKHSLGTTLYAVAT